MLLRWLLKKNVGARVDEVRNSCCLRRAPGVAQALRLLGNFAQFAVLGKAVFQVAADGASCNRASDRLPYLRGGFTVTALQIDAHRQHGRSHDPGQIVDGEIERDVLAIAKTV